MSDIPGAWVHVLQILAFSYKISKGDVDHISIQINLIYVYFENISCPLFPASWWLIFPCLFLLADECLCASCLIGIWVHLS